jgi:hypothetical protein
MKETIFSLNPNMELINQGEALAELEGISAKL